MTKDSISSIVSLLTSSSTLFCCALPGIFIILGAGATLASLTNFFPFLITLSVYKIELTLIAFIAMGIAGFFNYKSSFAPCPIDPELRKKCMLLRKQSRFTFYFSCIILFSSTLFTYIVPEFIK